jgi:dTDP-4-amino-4,6-dideoxygalactose transaminase
MKIPFNKPYNSELTKNSLELCLSKGHFSGDGSFTKECSKLMETNYRSAKVLLTTSCTHALEMAAILADIKPGDEVIMPSYTFVSTANAFVLRGAKIVFVDIRPDTLNLDEKLIEAAITPKTKAIVPVHYAGVSCEMDSILSLAKKYKLIVIEDAAQGVHSQYKGRYLGTFGELGCYSFHETKNFHCGEGGALLINDESFTTRAEIIREKGTDRSRFFRNQVDKYTWQDVGSSYLLSELNASFLLPQIEHAEQITQDRLNTWNFYFKALSSLQIKDKISLPHVPEECIHNAHMFYIKAKDLKERTALIDHLRKNGIMAIFHYIPLHSSPAGQKFGSFHGVDKFTTIESERLIRLPLFYGMKEEDLSFIVDKVSEFYRA